MVLGVPEPPRACLGRLLLVVVGRRGRRSASSSATSTSQYVRGGVHEHEVHVQVQQVRHRREHLRGDLVQRLEQEVHRPVGGVVAEAGQVLDEHPLGHPPGARPACEPGSRARWATIAKSTRSANAPSSRRAGGDPADRRADPQAVPQPVQHPRPAQPPGLQHLDLPPSAPGRSTARGRPPPAGSRNREIEATSRASAARSTLSARPKLWITFAVGSRWSDAARCAPTAGSTIEPSRFRPLAGGDQEHGRPGGPPRAGHRRRARRCGCTAPRSGIRADPARGDGRGRRRHSAVLPTAGIQAAVGRAERVHTEHRVPGGPADRRDRTARPGMAGQARLEGVARRRRALAQPRRRLAGAGARRRRETRTAHRFIAGPRPGSRTPTTPTTSSGPRPV